MSQISVIHISRLSGKLVGTSMRSKDFAKASGKLVGTSMRSKDLAKASGLDLRQP